MEIADIIEAQRCYWANTKPDASWFKSMFHPVDGLALIRNALSAIPPPFGEYFCEMAAGLYKHLQETVMASVYVKSKITPSGSVLVKSRDGTHENEETAAEFTANVMRTLRNTHHGYFTAMDERGRRPSRYLALVSGDTPETFSYLGVLFALALLADPERMIAWRPMPVGRYD
jgi:hypothetical protein